MSEALTKQCLVVIDAMDGLHRCDLVLAPEASIGMALDAAQQLLSSIEADWQRGATGIYGRLRPRDFCYVDGDRIELYRSLPVDPRTRRRERSRLTSAQSKSPRGR